MPLPLGEAGQPLLNNTRKDHIHHALASYGNYRNYYFHRAAAVPDARLSLLPLELIQDAEILDLGCNAGKLTIECVTHLGASRAVGVDLDAVLIERAREGWSEARRSFAAAEEDVVFECVDFMGNGIWEGCKESSGESEGPGSCTSKGMFDVILLLSITKWLHLHHGDAGLMRLFRDLFNLLPEGGTLVVEPQEWANYKRAVSKNKALRDVYHGLKMRPNFQDELRDVGFTLEQVVEREEGGFSRPLMLWRKPVNTL